MAQRDLDRIWITIAAHDVAAADRLVDAIEERIALLREFPGIGSPTDRSDRKLSLGRYPYVLSYAVTDAILILGVRHMAQQPP